MFLTFICDIWSFWEHLSRLLNQTKLYFVSQEQEHPMSQVDQAAGVHGADPVNRTLEATQAAKSPLVILLHPPAFPGLSRFV